MSENGEREEVSWSSCLWGQTAHDRRNNRRFVMWCFAWAVALVGSNLVQKYSDIEGMLLWLVIFLPVVPAAMSLLSYLKFLRETDELQRRIQVEGLALGFGVGVFLLLIGVQLPENAVPLLDASDALAVMMFCWVAGQFWGVWRYR